MDQRSIAIKDHHGCRTAASEHVHSIMRINGHSNRFAQWDSIRQLLPAIIGLVDELAGTEQRHRCGIRLNHDKETPAEVEWAIAVGRPVYESEPDKNTARDSGYARSGV